MRHKCYLLVSVGQESSYGLAESFARLHLRCCQGWVLSPKAQLGERLFQAHMLFGSTQCLVGSHTEGLSFFVGCWLVDALSSLSHGPLHREAHSMAAGFSVNRDSVFLQDGTKIVYCAVMYT